MAVPTYFPDVVHAGELLGGGTPSEDRRSRTLAAGDSCRIQWAQRNGSALLTPSATSTDAGLTLRARSSASKPLTNDDRCLILPDQSEWDATYDGTSNVSPTVAPYSFGETISGTGSSAATSASGLRLTTTSTSYRYFSRTGMFSTSDRLGVMIARLQVHSTHAAVQQIWCGFPHAGTRNSWSVQLAGSGGGANSWRISGQGSVYYPGWVITPDVDLDLRVQTYLTSGAVLEAIVYARLSGSFALRSLEGWTELGACTLSTDSARIIFGNALGNGVTDVTWKEICWFAGQEWVTLPTLPTRQYVQVEVTSPNGGVFSALDLKSNDTAPSAPPSASAASFGSGAIGVLVSPGSGNEVIRVDCLDAVSTVVASKAEYVVGSDPVSFAFAGLADGTYTFEAYGVSADGIPSGSSVISDPVILPAESPSVAITLDDMTLDAGQTANLTATMAGGATATLNGSALTSGVPVAAISANTALPVVNVTHSQAQITPGQRSQVSATGDLDQVDLQLEGQAWDGSATDAVEAIASGTTPPGAVTARIAQPPSRPVVRIV